MVLPLKRIILDKNKVAIRRFLQLFLSEQILILKVRLSTIVEEQANFRTWNNNLVLKAVIVGSYGHQTSVNYTCGLTADRLP